MGPLGKLRHVAADEHEVRSCITHMQLWLRQQRSYLLRANQHLLLLTASHSAQSQPKSSSISGLDTCSMPQRTE